MCGIAGMLDLVPRLPPAEPLVAAMADALAHRGPDDAGLLVDPPVVLAHRRLSIIDVSAAGHQPMASPGGAHWITFNGEIYNYVELAAELRTLGHRFAGSSDTEVLLHALDEWGEDALRRLNGDFAFAVWDRGRQTLTCVRDRLGVKPLYYTVAGGRFRFASEIKALLLDPAVPRRANDARVLDFLARGLADHTGETMFDGIRQLPPAHLLVATPDGVGEPRRWYERVAADPPRDAVAEVRDLFEDAVRIRLRSDVPVGTALSGGMDSSAVAAVASAIRAGASEPPPAAFSARVRDPRIDELRFAHALVRATGADYHRVLPDDDELLRELDGLLWHMDEPFHSPTVYGHWKVFDLARSHGVVVMLEGQAGDELLCGYDHLQPAFLMAFLASGRPLRGLAELEARRRLRGQSRRRAAEDVLRHLVPGSLRGRSLPTWLAADTRPPRPPTPGLGLRSNHRYLLGVAPLPAYLHHDDRNSLSVGVESRSPFFDHRLAELALSLRPDQLLRDGLQKWVLRQAVAHVVPREIVERPHKQGFTVDQTRWLDGALGQAVLETLRSDSAAGRPFFDPPALARILPVRPEQGHSPEQIWRAFAAERWLRLFVDPQRLEPVALGRPRPRFASGETPVVRLSA